MQKKPWNLSAKKNHRRSRRSLQPQIKTKSLKALTNWSLSVFLVESDVVFSLERFSLDGDLKPLAMILNILPVFPIFATKLDSF